MKKVFVTILALLMLQSLFVMPATADESDIIEENGFVCERLRNGNLKLVGYKGTDEGNMVSIPSTVKGSQIERIGAYAFDGCKKASITIPSTVKMIESFAFNDCTKIQKITIPNSVSFIDGNPFTGCTSLVNIDLDPKHPTLQVTTDGALYSTKNKMLICYPCSKQDRSFSVKDGTITIGKNAFYGCTLLQSIKLPTTIKGIANSAFQGCTGLISIALPESLLSIGELAFAGCAALSTVAIPKEISRIKRSCFFNCVSLASVTFPENLTEIEDMAFFGCKSLREIHLPESTTSIGNKAFNGCTGLTDAFIPVSVTEIGDSTFENCSVQLYLHINDDTYAEIYAKLYNISYTYDTNDDFLKDKE